MESQPSPRPRLYPRGLALGAYVTWLAVAIEVLRRPIPAALTGSVPTRYVIVVLLLVYLGGLIPATRPGRSDVHWWRRWPLALMLAGTFALLPITGPGMAPALLVVFAVVAVLALPLVQAAVVLIAANIGLAVMFALLWPAQALLSFLIYVGFQLFAAMAAHAMRKAAATATELRDVNAHLLATRSLLAESARESERLRLSRELHEVSGHKLTALKLNLAVLSRDPSLAERRELQASRVLADELLDEIRGVVSQLRRHEGIDLRNAFERLAEHLPSPRVHVEVADDARVEDTERAAALVRLAQEGLTNSARHAGARNVWLKLTRAGDHLQLLIEDDGRLDQPLRPGHGVTGMRERVAELGGQLDIGSAGAGGLRLCAIVPRERVA
jgi:signal transduction histidine kinase